MGWAKYNEDNMSIYIGRMAVKDSVPVYGVQSCEMKRVVEKHGIRSITTRSFLTDSKPRQQEEIFLYRNALQNVFEKRRQNQILNLSFQIVMVIHYPIRSSNEYGSTLSLGQPRREPTRAM